MNTKSNYPLELRHIALLFLNILCNTLLGLTRVIKYQGSYIEPNFILIRVTVLSVWGILQVYYLTTATLYLVKYYTTGSMPRFKYGSLTLETHPKDLFGIYFSIISQILWFIVAYFIPLELYKLSV